MFKVVPNLEDLIRVFVVRGIVFIEEQGVLSIANQKTIFIYLFINNACNQLRLSSATFFCH